MNQCTEVARSRSSQGNGPSLVEVGHTSVRTQFAQDPSLQLSGLPTICSPFLHSSPIALLTHSLHPLNTKQKVIFHHWLPDVTQKRGVRKGFSKSIHGMMTHLYLEIYFIGKLRFILKCCITPTVSLEFPLCLRFPNAMHCNCMNHEGNRPLGHIYGDHAHVCT